MSSSNPASRDLEGEAGDEALEYRPISTAAVGGLLLGLASGLAFIHPLLWLLPLAGAIVSGWALRRLASPEAMQIGRKAALVGLTLSLAFGISGPVHWALQRFRLHAEARHLAREWFQYLRDGDPYRAHQLTMLPSQRVSADDDLAARYAEANNRHEIENYVQEPAVQTLLSLGKYAAVRYFQNESLYAASGESSISDIYAVSVEDQGKTTSFFVKLHWVRRFDYGKELWTWRLSNAEFMRSLPAGFSQPS